MANGYQDPRVACTDDGVRVANDYLPGVGKLIPYQAIRSIRRIQMRALSGRARIWGSANPRYWANLDPGRPRKKVAFILDVGRAVRPFITPNDPDAFEAALTSHSDAPVERGGRRVVI